MIAPFEEFDGGQRGVETADVDYSRVVFHYRAFTYVVAAMTVR